MKKHESARAFRDPRMLQAIFPLLTIRSAEHETQDSSACMREYRTVLYIIIMSEQR